MAKKLPTTPRTQIKNALRKLWLQSRERAAAIKREQNTCQRCHRKGSKAKGRELKIHVHHIDGIDWDGIVDLIIERVLQSPDHLEVLCDECHDKEHQ